MYFIYHYADMNFILSVRTYNNIVYKFCTQAYFYKMESAKNCSAFENIIRKFHIFYLSLYIAQF